MEYAPEQKTKIITAICKNYVDGKTIESCCKAEGIGERTFNRWVEQADLAELYKKAKEDRRITDNTKLRDSARRGIWVKVDWHDVKKTKFKPDPENPDKPIIVEQLIENRPPDTTACIAVLNNLDPDFSPLKPIAEQTTDAHLDAALDVTNLYKDDKPKVSRSNQLKN